MNVQLANVLSDMSGMTGQAIVKAILAGERDPYLLAALRNWRVKASEEEIARSLEGNWQEDLVFVLQQEHDGYEFCHKQMAECAKLARLVYRMLRYGIPFIDREPEFYDAQHRKLQINYLKRKAANLGFQIIEAPAA
jgi:hypothetical protein